MLKLCWTITAIFVLIFNSLAQSDVSKSRWKTQDILIDGNDREWTKPLNFYDDKSGLLFAISNDNRNLYMAFGFNNEMKMGKLMNGGWSVTLSSKEKKRKFNASLIFPGVKTGAMPGRRTGEFEKKTSANSFIKDYQSNLQPVLVKGFRNNQTEIHAFKKLNYFLSNCPTFSTILTITSQALAIE